MRVFVLGHRGMLGHVVARYLEQQGCEVLTSSLRYSAEGRDPLVEAVRDSGCEWVVNALGRIKQKSQSPADLYQANALFPLQLKLRLQRHQRLVHASTDCVFSGRTGQYPVDGERDAEDVYGVSKALGESAAEAGRCWVLRTSIIGPELGGGFGLMGWFLRQQGEVNGFTNHLWNGLTTLEWAKICADLIAGRLVTATPLVQAGFAPAVTKCELLGLIAKVWNHPVKIRPVAAPEGVDRSLQPTLQRPSLEAQLRELHAWYPAVSPAQPQGR